MSHSQSLAFLNWYRDYLQKHLPNFRGTELLISETPPQSLWFNCVIPMLALQWVRAHFGRPVVINSAYRPPKYNAKTPGAVTYSQHQIFTAFDISVAGVPPAVVKGALLHAKISVPGALWRDEVFNRKAMWSRVPPKHFDKYYLLSGAPQGSRHSIRLNGGLGVYHNFLHVDARGHRVAWEG